MICTVFAGMWLEAVHHILLMRNNGEDVAKKADKKSWEEKRPLLGLCGDELFGMVYKSRRSRKDLVREKAFFAQDTVSIAQDEVELAYRVVGLVEKRLRVVGTR